MHVEGMASTPTTTPTEAITDVDAIAETLKRHTLGPDGCTCGEAPEAFWDRDLRTHIGAVMVAEGWVKAP